MYVLAETRARSAGQRVTVEAFRESIVEAEVEAFTKFLALTGQED